MSVYARGSGAFLRGKFNSGFLHRKITDFFSFFGEIQKQIMNP